MPQQCSVRFWNMLSRRLYLVYTVERLHPTEFDSLAIAMMKHTDVNTTCRDSSTRCQSGSWQWLCC
jgi:hypothetical protein